MRVETRFTGFANRAAAGRQLAKALGRHRGKANTIVVGLPRGGVITAATVAEDLDLPLDVLGDGPPLDCARKKVIVVDDGLATGSTMAAAIAILRREAADWIILAVPVAPLQTLDRMYLYVDEMVCLATPEPFRGVGYWYSDFAQVDDEEVRQTLARAHARVAVEA